METSPLPDAETLATIRNQRIQEFLTESLGAADPLKANLKVVISDLMNYQSLLNDIFMKAFRDSDGTGMDLETLRPCVDTSVKLCNQIEKLANLISKIT